MTAPKDLKDPNQFDICESPAPNGFPDLEPCCRARLHKDRCLFWKQVKSGGNSYAITTYEIDGGEKPGLKARSVQHLDMSGKSTFEEVAALIQYLEWVASHRDSGSS